MVYGLYRHTLFHGCERGLKGVTFYYTERKHRKKVTFKVQSGPQNCTQWMAFAFALWMPLFMPLNTLCKKSLMKENERKVMEIK